MMRKIAVCFLVAMGTLVASAHAQTKCVEYNQKDCFGFQVNAVKFDPNNSLHAGMSDPVTGRKFINEHFADWTAYLASSESVSPSPQSIYIALWTNQEVRDDELVAFSVNKKGLRTKIPFENVTATEPTVVMPRLGAPKAVYKIRTQGDDPRAASLLLPKYLIEQEKAVVLVYVTGSAVHPPPLKERRSDPSLEPVRGAWLPSTHLAQFYSKGITGVSIPSLFTE